MVLAAGAGQGNARQSTERNPRASVESMGGESASTRSCRSSFALERASFDANRSSLEAFGRHESSASNRPSVELAQVRQSFTPPKKWLCCVPMLDVWVLTGNA